MPDDELEAIREPLADTAELVRRRMHKQFGVYPEWLGRALLELARNCYRRGDQDAHEKRTMPSPKRQRTPFDFEPTPVRSPWGDDDDGR